MPDPIIPSGRDYDAGLAPGERKGEKQGLLGRIAGKIRKGRASKLHDFELRLDPRVGAREAQARERAKSSTLKNPLPSKQPERTKPDTSTWAQQAEPVPVRPAGPSLPNPQASSSIESLLESQVPGGNLGLATWLLMANPDDCSASAVEYLDHMASTCADITLASVVAWRLSAATSGDKAASHALTLDAARAPDLPVDIAKVLEFLAANPMSLAKYRGDVGLREGNVATLAELRLFCRDYPSVLPVLVALEAGDVATALRAVNIAGAAWHYGMSIINAAVAAVGGVTSTVDLPICRTPRAWLTGSAAQRCMAAALSSIVPDDERSRLRRRFEPDFAAAVASMSDENRVQAAVWLSDRGVSLVATTHPPKRRELRSLGTGSVPTLQQPRGAAEVRNRCRRCGIGESKIGGVCWSCADGGD